MPQKSKNDSFHVSMHDTQMMETQENDFPIQNNTYGDLGYLLTFKPSFSFLLLLFCLHIIKY